MDDELKQLETQRKVLKNEIDRLNARQMCIKVLINATYGLNK